MPAVAQESELFDTIELSKISIEGTERQISRFKSDFKEKTIVSSDYRTRTLVSTARMAFLYVRADTFFKFVQVLRGRSAIREYRLMDVFGRVLPDSTNDDVFALFVPF